MEFVLRGARELVDEARAKALVEEVGCVVHVALPDCGWNGLRRWVMLCYVILCCVICRCVGVNEKKNVAGKWSSSSIGSCPFTYVPSIHKPPPGSRSPPWATTGTRSAGASSCPTSRCPRRRRAWWRRRLRRWSRWVLGCWGISWLVWLGMCGWLID